MIDKFGGIYTPTCDQCGRELPGEFEFYDAVNAKKSAGWKIRKTKDGWEDICDECLREEDDG